jgi:hypothetical protein
MRARERTVGADSDETVHYRGEGKGEGEDWGLTVMRIYIIGKRARARERTVGLTAMRLYILGKRVRARERTVRLA